MKFKKTAILGLVLALVLSVVPVNSFAEGAAAESGADLPIVSPAPAPVVSSAPAPVVSPAPAPVVNRVPASNPTSAPTEPLPMPTVVISRADMPEALKAGQEADIAVSFQNISDVELKSAAASFTPSGSLSIVGTSSVTLSSIPGKGSKSITLRVKAADDTGSGEQRIGVELRFSYFNNSAMTQGSASESLSIPVLAKVPDKDSPPSIVITRSALKPISANQSFDFTLTVKNAGTMGIQGVIASVSTSDGLVLQNDTTRFDLGAIAPGNSAPIALKLLAGKELSSSNQTVSLELKYTYELGGKTLPGSVSERVNLAANPSSPAEESGNTVDMSDFGGGGGGGGIRTDSPVPNVIVSSYSYGSDSVSAGSKFSLDFAFKNTGKLKIENIVLTVDGGDSFTMNGSTNTFYYELLNAGAEQKQTANMQTLVAAKTGAQTLGLTFKYEYVDGGKRSNATADIKLSLPVFQPDRFKVNPPAIPESVNAGEETTLTLSYVNKGKAEVGNVEITIEGDVEVLAKTQYLGNFDSGKSGTIGFAFTPKKAGELKLTLLVGYEDSSLQPHTLKFPVTLTVQEAPPAPEDLDAEYGQSQGSGIWKWIGIVAAVLLAPLGILGFKYIKKKKQAVKTTDAAWDNWADDDKDHIEDADFEPEKTS